MLSLPRLLGIDWFCPIWFSQESGNKIHFAKQKENCKTYFAKSAKLCQMHFAIILAAIAIA